MIPISIVEQICFIAYLLLEKLFWVPLLGTQWDHKICKVGYDITKKCHECKKPLTSL